MDLKEWTRIYLKQRDLIKKEIEDIEETPTGFLIKTEHGERKTVVEERLETARADIICCLNTKENVKHLIQHWQEYEKEARLLIIFANPETNEQWLIKPHHHGKIADEDSLEAGLMSMSESITAA